MRRRNNSQSSVPLDPSAPSSTQADTSTSTDSGSDFQNKRARIQLSEADLPDMYSKLFVWEAGAPAQPPFPPRQFPLSVATLQQMLKEDQTAPPPLHML